MLSTPSNSTQHAPVDKQASEAPLPPAIDVLINRMSCPNVPESEIADSEEPPLRRDLNHRQNGTEEGRQSHESNTEGCRLHIEWGQNVQ